MLLLLIILALSLPLTSCSGSNFLNIDREEENSGKADEILIPDAWETVKTVVDLIQKDDSLSLLNHIYPKALERYGRAQIVDRNAKIHADLAIRSIRYTNLAPVNKESGRRQLYYSADAHYETRYGSIKKPVTLSFLWRPEAKAWELDWTPVVILPGLNAEGMVRIENKEARRGNIYDRRGYPLAVNDNLIRISLVPQNFDRSRTAEVARLLDIPESLIEDKLAQPWAVGNVLVPITLLSSLNEAQIRMLPQYQLSWDRQPSRSYPFGAALAHLIGYVGHPDEADLEITGNEELSETRLIGKSGLEQIYERRLRGEDGYRLYVSGSYEQTLLEKPARDGEDIWLSIDAICQREIYEAIKDENMTVTALDPKSGDILALVSVPSYDPAAFVLGISQSDYDTLLADARQPLSAKFAYRLAPGSTQKILTAIIALENGTVSAESKKYIEGKTWQKDASWGNYYVSRYQERNQEFSLEDALCYSDNIFFAQLACEMGADAFSKGMEKLGIGRPITDDYPFPIPQLSNKTTIAENETVLLADTAYGQGELLLPPVHLAAIYAALVNEGRLMQPRLDLSHENQVWQERLLQPAEIELLRRGLERVADEQYAKQLEDERLKFSGKSGTAEMGLDSLGEMRLNSWFVGYEREQPTICLALTHFESQTEEHFYGIAKFADLFRRIYRQGSYRVPTASPGKILKKEQIPDVQPLPRETEEEASSSSNNDHKAARWAVTQILAASGGF